jgi:hypothetical protein
LSINLVVKVNKKWADFEPQPPIYNIISQPNKLSL